LGLDPADAPANDTQPVDHRRMRVSADERVRVRQQPVMDLFPEDDSREVLQVDLVHDAGVWRHDPEVLECVLSPAEEGIAFPVARELEPGVEVGGVRLGEVIDLNRMIDDELDRLQRVDLPWITSEPK